MTIAEIIALILQGGPIALDLFIKLESILNLTSDEKQNILKAVAMSDAADDDTIARANAWLAANPVT